MRTRSCCLTVLPVLILLALRSAAAAQDFVRISRSQPADPLITVSGDGKKSENPPTYAQAGRKAYVLSLKVPETANYAVSGWVKLSKPNGGFTITASKAGSKGRGSRAGIRTWLYKDKKVIRSHRSLFRPEKPEGTWFPVILRVMDTNVRMMFDGTRVYHVELDERPDQLTIHLGGETQMRNIELTTVPELADEMQMLFLDSIANVDLTATEQPPQGVALKTESVPSGINRLGELPLNFPDFGKMNAVDVAASLRGFDQLRLKHSYLHHKSTTKKNRLVVQVPGDQYHALHLIAFSAGRQGHVPRMTVRMGLFGPASGILEDVVVEVPRLDGDGESNFDSTSVPVKLANGKTGYFHHIRVPVPQTGNLREFGRLDVELTRDVNTFVPVPDPYEFGEVPAGLPSDVVVLAATMERSPVTMSYTTAEPGNIFHEDQRVVFNVMVKNRSDKPVEGITGARAVGPGTAKENAAKREVIEKAKQFTLKPDEEQTLALDLTPGRRGWFQCDIRIEAGGRKVQSRRTSFAVLAPDTRQAMEDSPFGVWCFWHPHKITRDPDRADNLGSIILKGGWRWTYGGAPGGRGAGANPPELYRRMKKDYKLTWTTQSPPHAYQRKTGWYDAEKFQEEVVPWLKAAREKGIDNNYKVLHESRSSTSILRRYSEFLGGEPYDMPEDERKRLETQFEKVKQYCAALKKADPEARIVLGNDYPAFIVEYLKRDFPRDSFDVIGIEGAMFMRDPERQPDWLCLLGQVIQLRRAMKKYGYEKPVWFTEALYHSTNPGNVSLHRQGVLYTREAMLALANGIQRMSAQGVLVDSSDDYRWSNWGSAGYCFRDPEYNPKPSYAMFAWLTQLLDRADFAGHLETGSTALHVLDFKKPDGAHIYPVWTVRGRQKVALKLGAGQPIVYDAYGNRLAADVEKGQLILEATDTPLYVTGTTVEAVLENVPIEVKEDAGRLFIGFDDPKQVKPVAGRNTVVESNWDTPRIKGRFKHDFVTEDGATALRVELLEDEDPRKLLPRYVELELAEPIEFQGRPWRFLARVKGNGGWGRVMFELVDAKGRVWTSCGNQYAGACNSSDNKATSFVNFDGWHTLWMPLPGQYPGADQFVRWPRNSEWWPTNTPEAAERARQRQEAQKAGTRIPRSAIDMGTEPVDYPVKLTKIIVTMRPHILYVNEQIPIKKRVIFIDTLRVEQAPERM